MEWKELKQFFLKQGFLDVAYVPLKEPISHSIYSAQMEFKNFGSMDFLKTHTKIKNQKNINSFSHALVAIFPYYPNSNALKSSLQVAFYAQEKDYHFSVTEKLKNLSKDLNKHFPESQFKPCVDSFPILERDLAYRGGLGWIGKNTCLLDKKKGSLFYIAELLCTPLDLKNSPVSLLKTDHCGVCTRCLDACPTQALTPHKMIVDRCISYRTIEDRDLSPGTLNKPTHGWFFGCDICQTVCPWNEKSHSQKFMEAVFVASQETLQELKDILFLSNKQLAKKYKDFPLMRARPSGLKRNALKIIYEHHVVELLPFLKVLKVPASLFGLKEKVVQSLESKTDI